MVVGELQRSYVSGTAYIVPGQTGLGKSTLVNTLFASHLVESKGRFEPETSPRSTTEIHPQSHGTFLSVVSLRLT